MSSLSLVFWLAVVLAGQAAAQAPVAVVSAAGFGNVVAPDSLASLFGTNLTDRVAPGALAPGGQLPLELDSVSVRIAGRPAGLIFVSPSQINFWLPPDTPIGSSAVEVRNTRTGSTATGSIAVSTVAPGMFSADCLRPDVGAILNGITFEREPFASVTPSTPGDDKSTRLSIFGTGLRNADAVEALLVDSSGRQSPLQVEFVGPAPAFFGLDQINVVLTPKLEGLGVATILLRADGAESNAVSVRLAPRELLDASRVPYSIGTVAGAGASDEDGPALEARLQAPAGVAVDRHGNLYIADEANHVVRRVDLAGRISTVAGKGEPGSSGDDGPAVAASLNSPAGVAVGPSGDLFIADRGNHKIRRVSPSGAISTFAGTGLPGSSGDGGPAVQARLSSPRSVAVDALANVIIADTGSHAVRRVTSDGWISRLAGSGEQGFSGDNGPARLAQMRSPTSVAVGEDGTLYIADAGNSRVRRVSRDGAIRTLAGAGELGSSVSLSIDPLGRLLIADTSNHRLHALGSDCTVEPIAGSGEPGFGGDGGTALEARLDSPAGVVANAAGELFLADSANGRVRGLDRFALEPGAACGQPGLLTVAPRHGVASQVLTATVRLTCPADFDATIALRSDGFSAEMPSGVVVPAGRTVASFEIVLPAVEEATAARIVATSGTAEVFANVTVLPAGSGLTLKIQPATVVGGETALGVVTLGAPAGPGGATVRLSSSSPGVARTASAATVPEGRTRAAFLIPTSQVDRLREISLTAAEGDSTASAALTVLPAGGPLILDFAITPNPVRAGDAATGRITLSGPAGAGGQVVRINSGDRAAASAPESVEIPAGGTAVEFPIATTPAQTPRTVTMTASGPNQVRRQLVIDPDGPAGSLAGITNLDVLPNPVIGGQSGNGLVTLAAPAPAGGVRVLLSSSGEAVTVAASMTIPEGETRAFFRFHASPVAATTTVVITAASANALGATLTVAPATDGLHWRALLDSSQRIARRGDMAPQGYRRSVFNGLRRPLRGLGCARLGAIWAQSCSRLSCGRASAGAVS